MIYFIQNSITKNIKIGISRNVKKRLTALQTSNAEKLILLRIIDGWTKEEKILHRMFQEYRINGEWFSENNKLLELINDKEYTLIKNSSIKQSEATNEFDFILSRVFGKTTAMSRW